MTDAADRLHMDIDDLKPLRYPATCTSCGSPLPRGTKAMWDKAARTATCAPCLGFIDRGVAGASAATMGAKRRKNYENRVHKAHPRLGKVILALSDDPRAVRSWEVGAVGEQQLGQALESFRDRGFGVLHDRRIPASKANIDHVVVGPAAIFVIDAKRYTGKVQRIDKGWIFARDWRLYVGGRDRTELVPAMEKQVAAIHQALGEPPCPVIPVLCFIDAEWGLFAEPLRFGDVRVMWPKKMYEFIASDGMLELDEIRRIERELASKLPSAG